MEIKCANKLGVLLQKPKRIKLLVGGRGSTKSTFVADKVNAGMSQGELWCCAREFQNSIDESVHRLLMTEIGRLGFEGFDSDKTHIFHESGGRNFYRGLARNITSIKSMLTGVDGLWIEEGETLSDETLMALTASLRLDATQIEALIAGEDVKMPEIWITMNRGSRNDPVSRKWLERAETELERCGFYEDDMIMIVEINYTDVPEAWFKASGLEQERLDDWANMPRSMYDHKWLGKYLEIVENSIILPEWFDAAIDAHVKLGFKPRGSKVVSFDPADEGADPKGLAYRHGSVFLDVKESRFGDVNDGCDWATDFAIGVKADLFTWDCDGLGVTLKRQVAQSLDGKGITHQMFKGSESVDFPEAIYMPSDKKETAEQKKTNDDTFRNKRAQYYWMLRDRFFNTYRAITKGEYIDPDELVSLSSKIENIQAIKAEVCRVPRKPNGNGLIQILSKAEMLKLKISSPNMADAMMMSMRVLPQRKWDKLPLPKARIA